MDGLVEFLQHEQAQSERFPIIVVHGGYLYDFPILLASCVKHNCDKFGMFVDSMQILQDGGYKRPDLDTMRRIKYKKKLTFGLYIRNCI